MADKAALTVLVTIADDVYPAMWRVDARLDRAQATRAERERIEMMFVQQTLLIRSGLGQMRLTFCEGGYEAILAVVKEIEDGRGNSQPSGG